MSTLSVNTIKDVQSFDFANTSFASAFGVANSGYVVANAAFGVANTAIQNTSGSFNGSLAFPTNANLSIGSATTGRVIITAPSGDGIFKASGDGTNYAGLGFISAAYGYTGTVSGTNLPFHIFQNGTARLTANVGGYIGIATTTPIVPFHVRFGANSNVGFFTNTYPAVGAFNDTFSEWKDFQVGPSVYFKNNGAVGVGTSTPGYLLDVGGAGATGVYSRLGGMHIITANTGYEWWTGTYSTAAGPWQLTYRKISDGTWSIPLHIETNGNVGIGTQSPSYKLDVTGVINTNDQYRAAGGGGDVRLNGNYAGTTAVVGTVGATGFGIMTSNDPSRLWITSGGYVGIGTQSPVSRLTIQDHVAITNSGGSQTLLMGNQDSGGVNKPGILRSYNGGIFEFGYGTSWSTSGGTFTRTVYIDNSGYLEGASSVRAPIFYDSNDTAYYINPNSGTTLSGTLTQSGGYVYLGSYNSASVYPSFGQNGLAIGNNFTGGNAELDLWNTISPSTFPNTGFRFIQQLSSSTYRDVFFIKQDGTMQMNSGYGSVATAYGCRAWAKFNGTSAVGAQTINGSGNISSVSKTASGYYTVNFSTAMPDTNYSVSVGFGNAAVDRAGGSPDTYATGSFRLFCWNVGGGGVDMTYATFSVHR